MELKHGINWRFKRNIKLLIVPYGIETVQGLCKQTVPRLLIVPYGIETKKCRRQYLVLTLLIVPYGIETY